MTSSEPQGFAADADQDGVESHADRGRVQPRPLRARRRALVLAAALGLALALLATAVFSIAARSRDVAAHSVRLHALNETLRAATVVRAQTSFAAYLAESDRVYGTRSKPAIRMAVLEARGNLAEVENALSAAPTSRAFDDDTRRAVVQFTAAAARTLARASSRSPIGSRLLVRDRLVPSFDTLRERLVSRRNTALQDVREAGSQLGRLGGLASFVIAFVLPTVAVLVYRQITTRSREAVELATALAGERGRSKRRRELLVRRLSELRLQLEAVEAHEAGERLPAIRRLRTDLDALLTVLAGVDRLAFEEVDLASELSDVVEAVRETGVDAVVDGADGIVWADPAVLGAVLRNLAAEAQALGARRVQLEAVATGESIAIVLDHDGAPLPPDIASVVFDRATVDDRAAAEGREAPVRLLAAVESVEAMGGSITPEVRAERTAYVVRLPRAGVHETVDPAPTEALRPLAT